MQKALWCSILMIAIFSQEGCSSLERTSDLKNQKLLVNYSTKTDVVNAVGLPKRVEKQGGNEIWLYSGKPINSSFFVPMPISIVPVGNNSAIAYYTDIGTKNNIDDKPITFICVFNHTGQLIEIQNLNQGLTQ